MIECVNIYKSYQSLPALHDICLSIPKGEIFGVIGKSGAGKSTFLRCLNLLERPDHGHICVDGDDLTTLSAAALRKARQKIGMIFQHFNLLQAKTIFENIALPLYIHGYPKHSIPSRVHHLLSLVDLQDKQFCYPSALSGGQKQRVAIARALASEPKVLLCDEATSALDPENTQNILELLQTIQQSLKLTIVLITHEMEVVKRICHRVGVMEAGKFIDITTLSDIFKSNHPITKQLMYNQLTPPLPPCLSTHLTNIPNHHPLLRIFFQGEHATKPFISETSRVLGVNINILLANIDRFGGTTCGILIVELSANSTQLQAFQEKCLEAQLSSEILGYLDDVVV
ncbi:MAG: ATP-binding cassette domain-containing protein [Legionellaceae bacterium]|nr:ATP-binding cassette domain-containing protein [Legionellaceae bacterium]